MVDQNVIRRIEESYFRYFRRKGEVAPGGGEPQSSFRWRALEAILGDEEPESWDAVEFNDDVAILVVIGGAAHLVQTTESEGITLSVGPLDGGTYEERVFSKEKDYGLVGRFEHPRLSAPLVIRAEAWNEFESIAGTRDRFRGWASSTGAATE